MIAFSEDPKPNPQNPEKTWTSTIRVNCNRVFGVDKNIIYSICNLGNVLDSILRRAFEKNRGYSKEVFEIHVLYAGMEPRYRTTSVLSKVPLD
jgi:hypothetical protein